MLPGFNSNEGTAQQQYLVVQQQQSVGSPVMLFPRINSLVRPLLPNPHRITLAPQNPRLPQSTTRGRLTRAFCEVAATAAGGVLKGRAVCVPPFS